MSDRIAAVVVTHNRLPEIKGAVAALRAQTRRPDLILVIDNGSTDGTREWLAAQSDLCVLHQSNLGMSGGIRRGLTYVLENGFDWGWVLDDDAHPEPGALEALCRAMVLRPEARVFNSVGMARTNPTRFAVGALWSRTTPDNFLVGKRAATLAEIAPSIDEFGMVDSIGGHFYHGVLLHRSLVETVGMPLPWLYHSGEEIEYGYRIMRAGYHIYSVMDSVVMHPEIPYVTFHLLGRTKEFKMHVASRRYYFIRNGMWIHRTYFANSPLMLYAARRLGGALLAELFVIPHKSLRNRLSACNASLRGVVDGLRLKPARDANGREILT